MQHVEVSTDRIEEIAYRRGGTITGLRRVQLVDGDTTYHATYPSDPQLESELVRAERVEERAAYADGLAEHDTRVVGGRRYLESDIPSADEL